VLMHQLIFHGQCASVLMVDGDADETAFAGFAQYLIYTCPGQAQSGCCRLLVESSNIVEPRHAHLEAVFGFAHLSLFRFFTHPITNVFMFDICNWVALNTN